MLSSRDFPTKLGHENHLPDLIGVAWFGNRQESPHNLDEQTEVYCSLSLQTHRLPDLKSGLCCGRCHDWNLVAPASVISGIRIPSRHHWLLRPKSLSHP